jgi:hypothetical protein
MDWTREDLENKSKEELIDIIMNIQEDLEYFQILMIVHMMTMINRE